MLKEKVNEAVKYISERISTKPQIGLILGSGLGVLADEIEEPVKVAYQDIPGFPVSTVEGHAGQLVYGSLQGVPVIAMQGRFHFYEGYPIDMVTLPVRVMKELGIETMIVTNAAGGVNQNLKPGDLMLITDHINNTGQNPLIGPNDSEVGVRFPDMSTAYDQDLRVVAKKAAEKLGLTLKDGVYVWNSGPSYETPAEVKMIRYLGGDAVGMSTVPEVIVARHAGINVLGVSCISNMAAGILDQPLSHTEVIETTEYARENFLSFIREVIFSLNRNK
ncbi:purine-nucleoside phosphorylase [Desertibacillus haloalkaliphilus]|uniref:purine-nucleoside phosphorylase n=1 Tax=Desertibacillus haloalkaliphilus TaxID=1328930 RepID=UPI001C25B4DA|nr:purine-nucleoside phosphorylase [Desertibacillus haloalkaliphilus]MBU8907847.1 purine-nucleoside phosphorylase [Desertibacillus haloalkaliphilus]